MTSPDYLSSQIQRLAETARQALAQKHSAREVALRLSREVTRHSANAIRAIHRHELPQAQELLAQARVSLDQAQQLLSDHPDVFYAGFIEDAQKEFAEASCLLAIVTAIPLPQAQELAMGQAPYLNGLAEAASELRRYILDTLRRDQTDRCEELMGVMDEIYSLLVTMDFPDAITGGLRRNTDMLRGVLERTRGDLTLTLQQKRLEEKLRAIQSLHEEEKT